MNLGELWWNRLVNSVRFLDDVKEALIDGKSVVLNFSDKIPWTDDLISGLEQKLSVLTDVRSFTVNDVSSDNTPPAKYLFEHYFNETERQKYWPNRSYEQFMAENDNTPLNRRILCIKGISYMKAAAWLKTVTEYLEHRNSDERCIFILLVQQMPTNSSKLITSLKYSDYVSDYDCFMLCLTLLSSENCTSAEKIYVSEIAGNIAANNVEKAGILAKAGIALAEDTLSAAGDILAENGIILTNLNEIVEKAVWEAQIRLVFPRLEDFRREMVQKYNKQIQKHLPVTSSSGERVNKASEVEIGPLCAMCIKEKFMMKADLDRLIRMRDARNSLAHRDTLTYKQLRELEIFGR